ncbi:hypothetical protein AB0L06_42535 [Spirillospora sp. NPDC052269]
MDEIAFSDPASPCDEDEFSFGDYFAAEDALLSLAESLHTALGAGEIRVVGPILGVPLPGWLSEFRNSTVVTGEQALRLLRSALRGVRIGCDLSLTEDGSALIGIDFDGLLRVDLDERHSCLLLELLPDGLEIAVEQPTPPHDDGQRNIADDRFWQALTDLLPKHPDGLLLIERWADGSFGETWRLANARTVDRIRGAVREHSLLVVAELPALEEIDLAARFDDTSVRALDDLDLRYFRPAPDSPDLGIAPLTAAALAADPDAWTRPVRVVSSWTAAPLLAAVVPDRATGAVTAHWPTW